MNISQRNSEVSQTQKKNSLKNFLAQRRGILASLSHINLKSFHYDLFWPWSVEFPAGGCESVDDVAADIQMS